jgi:hypothetical protein
MDTHSLLLPLRLLSSQNPTSSSSSSCIPRSHNNNNNHLLKLFSTTHINRFSNFATIANSSLTIPTTDHTPTTPTLKDLCHAHVPDQFLQRQFQPFSLFNFFPPLFPPLTLTLYCLFLFFLHIPNLVCD